MRQRIKLEHIFLFLIFLFVLGFRLYFAFQSDNFNSDSAYFHLRHIEHLLEEKGLLAYDDLSYGGREIIYPPLFHIVMALLSFGSLFMLKFIPELAISLTVFIVYIIAKEISGSTYSALFSSLLASFYPILFMETLNNLSAYTFVIPLLLIMFYSLLRLEEKKYLWLFVISSFVLPLLHPSAFIFIATVLVYFVLLLGGALNPTKLKKEAVIFSVFLIILLELIIYKKAFIEYGANVLWQNVPSNILSDSFRDLSVVDLLIGVGLLPLILGVIGIYISLVNEKRKVAFLFASFGLTILILLVLRFLTISIGLMYLGIILSIFSASSLSKIYDYFGNIKFNYLKNVFVVLIIILFFVSSLSPSFLAVKKINSIADADIKEVEYIKTITQEGSIVLGNVDEGNLIATVAGRKTVLDTNFLLALDPLTRTKDVDTIYTTVSEAIAINNLKKYNVSVIYVSDKSIDQYNITYDVDGIRLSYTKGSSCFESVRGGRYYVIKC